MFRYIAARPQLKIVFEPGADDTHKEDCFNDVKTHIKGLTEADYKHSYLVSVFGTSDMTSRWLLLPGNRIVLLNFYGTNVGEDETKFMNYTLGRYDTTTPKEPKRVVILFDAQGKIVHDYYISKKVHFFRE